MAWSAGQQLQRGKYTIEKELGSGRFGITYLARDRTSQRCVIKTYGFTPLELYHVDAERGAYTDVYSLAATLYQLLTGEKPPSVRDRSLARAKLKPPQEVNPQMSDRTNQAILRGMALAPEERPQTMQKWLNLLGVAAQIPQPWRNWDLTIWLTIIGTIAGVLSMIAGFLALKPPSTPLPEPTPEMTPTSQQIQPETCSLDLTPP
ncbi:MAG: hypothetical protein RIM23_27215 [Coleofasciculus sp. G3-WIS-01]|uniref:hypothetical protein n=1 Tax=Coleofasciculus sp. G3-WIS-01 TaxID=3069528 RepID=UPI003301CFB5